MNKILIVLMFIFLGTSILIVSSMGKEVENSFTIEYQNNKNLNLPDLTGKSEISTSLYRLYNISGVTIDYNSINGQYIINGTQNGDILVNISPITTENGKNYTSSYIYISGTGMITINWISPNQNLNMASLSNENNEITVVSQGQTMIRFYSGQVGRVFDNFTFKLQLEKGQTATSYIVPKLIPVYKDNLTIDEKQQIGFGAFGGLSQIIRSVDNVIKPIGNFINGVLNLFK